MTSPGPKEDQIRFDPSQGGLRKFLNRPEELILRFVWATGEYGVDSASAWRVVSERLPPGETISRATVIHYLNRMVDRGVLGVREVTGKGGHRKIYFPLLDENGLIMDVLGTVFHSMMDDFPEETMKIVESQSEG